VIPNLLRDFFRVGNREFNLINELEGALGEAGLEPASDFYEDLINYAVLKGAVDYLGELYRYSVERIKGLATQDGLEVVGATAFLNASDSSGGVIIRELDEEDLEDKEKVENYLSCLEKFNEVISPLKEFILIGVGTSIYNYKSIDSYISELRERLEELEEEEGLEL